MVPDRPFFEIPYCMSRRKRINSSIFFNKFAKIYFFALSEFLRDFKSQLRYFHFMTKLYESVSCRFHLFIKSNAPANGYFHSGHQAYRDYIVFNSSTKSAKVSFETTASGAMSPPQMTSFLE